LTNSEDRAVRRVPVVATVREAYAFTFANLGGIIGLIWVPMLLLTVTGFFSSQHLYNDAIEAMASDNAARMGPSLLLWLGYVVSALLLQAMMFTSVTQLALGARSAPVFAHFAFGPLEWRMFRAMAGFAMLMLVVFLAGNILISAAAARAPQALALLVLAFYGVLLVFIARLFLLLPAIAVADSGPVMRRVWLVSAGNFPRLFAVLMAIAVPVFILSMLLLVPVAGHAPPPPTRGGLQLDQLEMMVWLREVLPYVWGLIFLVWPLLAGLIAGAGVSAWRSLTSAHVLDVTA
jgi:hypothetical protein